MLGVKEEELGKVRNNISTFENMKSGVLGKQLEVSGRATKNDMFNRVEFIANSVEELKPENILRE